MGGGDGRRNSESGDEDKMSESGDEDRMSESGDESHGKASGGSNKTPLPALELEVVCDCMKVPTSPASVTVMAKLRARAMETEGAEDGSEVRAPITLCAAIDRSSSMKDHLPLLKETLRFMVQQLRPKDQLTLITFDQKVKIRTHYM